MRKAIAVAASLGVLGIAGTAIAGAPATNQTTGDFVEVSVKATPPISGTAAHPRGVGIIFDSFAGNRIKASQQGNNNSLSVHLAGFGSNAALFPACAVTYPTLSTCSAASKIGSGTAEGELLGSNGQPAYVPATVTAYNGKPYQTTDPTEIFIASVAGTRLELVFHVHHDHSGTTLNEVEFSSTGPQIYLSKFHLVQPVRSETRTVHHKKVKEFLMTAPTTCHGSWAFSETLGFSNEATLEATDTEPCIKG